MTDGVVAIAFDRDNPAAGLYIRTRRDWQLLPRGGTVPLPAQSPARPDCGRPRSSRRSAATPRSRPMRQQILSDKRLRNVRYTAAARAFDNRGWYLGTSGIGALYVEDGAPLPQRLSFGLPSDWGRRGVQLARRGLGRHQPHPARATPRSPLSPASSPNFDRSGSVGHRNAVRSGPRSGRSGQSDLGCHRSRRRWSRAQRTAAIELVDDSRGLPDSRVYSIVFAAAAASSVGTARGIARISDRSTVERLAPSFTDARVRSLPGRRLGLGRDPVAACCSHCPGAGAWCGRRA